VKAVVAIAVVLAVVLGATVTVAVWGAAGRSNEQAAKKAEQLIQRTG
jgi:hypothetical protein